MSGQLPPPPSFPPQGPPPGPPPQGPPPGWGTPPQGPPPGWGQPPGRRPSGNRALVVGGAVVAAIIVALVIVIVVLLVSGDDDDPVANDPDTPGTTESTEPAATGSPSEVVTEATEPVETPSGPATDQPSSSVAPADLAFTFPDSFRDLPLDVAESDQQVDRNRVGSTAYYDREDGSDLSFIWYPDNTLDDYLTYLDAGSERPTEKVGTGRCHPDLFGAYCVIELAGGVLTVADSSPDVELTATDAIAMLEEMAALVG